MKKVSRRTFFSGSLGAAAALSLPAALSEKTDLHPSTTAAPDPEPDIIDTNVHLFGWPFRRLKYAETKALVAKLRQHKITHAWAGSYEALFHKNINGVNARNNRLAFAPDGSLWVGQTDHGWAGDKGIQRIVFTGETPMDIYSMNLTVKGFDLTFTQPVDGQTAGNPDNYNVHHYYYAYYKKDESEDVNTSIQVDEQTVPVTNIKISPDRKKVSLTLGDLKPGYIYELKLENIKSTTGRPLANRLICYTLNKLITD